MAYFSNGTEGLNYQEQYCFRCEHLPDDPLDGDCPIWTAHLFYCHGASKETRAVLNLLIPMVPHTFTDGITHDIAGECLFFQRKQERLPLEAQASL